MHGKKFDVTLFGVDTRGALTHTPQSYNSPISISLSAGSNGDFVRAVRQVVAGQQTKSLGFEPDVPRSTRLGRQTGGEHDVRGPVRRPVGEHGEADAPGADPMTFPPKCGRLIVHPSAVGFKKKKSTH